MTPPGDGLRLKVDQRRGDNEKANCEKCDDTVQAGADIKLDQRPPFDLFVVAAFTIQNSTSRLDRLPTPNGRLFVDHKACKVSIFVGAN